MKRKERKNEKDGQGMKVIEKTSWERGKTVGGEKRRRMKRRMNENGECVKINKVGKTRKHIRWKRREFVEAHVEYENDMRVENGRMLKLKEFFEVVKVGKHTRGKGCNCVVAEIMNKWEWK